LYYLRGRCITSVYCHTYQHHRFIEAVKLEKIVWRKVIGYFSLFSDLSGSSQCHSGCFRAEPRR
jgi:hypothetical protein